MEVGAVKQAFNNEVIHLKKKMNQAKIQVIHKLTRKAKVLADKKVPEQIQAKMKRKAECAVREVLQIKKVTTKDLAKFSVTHKGKLTDYLNKPQIDLDRACARLLLHKSLQDKYKILRSTYTDIAIDDLLMSRDERRKIKQEERDKAKEKQKKKMDKMNEWKVEKIVPSNNPNLSKVPEEEEELENDVEEDFSHNNTVKSIISKSKENTTLEHDKESECSSQDISDENIDEEYQESNVSDVESNVNTFKKFDTPKLNKINGNTKPKVDDSEDDLILEDLDPENGEIGEHSESDETSADECIENVSQKRKAINSESLELDESKIKKPKPIIKPSLNMKKDTVKIVEKTLQNKKKNTNKNKKLTDKFQIKKLTQEAKPEERRIVDPFFITSSGENYMSLVEPRGPDEVKEHHQEGNRKLRRAAMFGRIPKFRRQNKFDNDNKYQNKYNSGRDFSNKNEFDDNNKNNFNRNNFSNNKFSNSNIEKVNEKVKDKANEKLHPSWEAKKKLSGLKPFEGKKIVFD